MTVSLLHGERIWHCGGNLTNRAFLGSMPFITTPVVNVEGIMEDSLRHLQKLGFTDYEARAYVALLRDYPATRYQLSQNASIPESKIYEVVRRLRDKGVITGLQGRPPRFVPLPPDELVTQLERRAHESLEYLRQTFPLLAEQPADQWIWNLEGYDAIISQGKSLLDAAQGEVMAALWRQEVGELYAGLKSASERGVDLTLLAYDKWHLDFGVVKQHGFERDLAAQRTDSRGRWMAMVVDRTHVLLGSSLDQSATGVWTNHPALANIVHRYVMEHFYDK
jgi:sugar-specific transcriptional regulator TrmB